MKKSTDINVYIYNESLKQIKRNVGTKCVHLANRKSTDGGRFIDVTLLISGEKKKFSFSLPSELRSIKKAEYEYIEELIKSKLD